MPHAPYTLGGPLLYPLPTAVLVLPLAHLSIQIAGAVFTSLSIALLTFALTRRAWWPLMMMLSAPFFLALWNVQWSMLLVACALLPGLGWLGVAKPNLGLMVFAIRPRWWTVIGSVALCIGCLFLIPNWPQEWMDHLRRQPSPHPPAVLWPFGFVGLVGLLRWRTLEGRALVAATLSPSSAWFYDQLFVMLVARNWRQALALGALSWISFIMVLATQAPINLIDPDRARGVQRIISLGVYLPAAILVLRQRNEGDVPDRVERLVARLPRWVRGVSSRSVRVGDPPQP
jgi:hypothetical protein